MSETDLKPLFPVFDEAAAFQRGLDAGHIASGSLNASRKPEFRRRHDVWQRATATQRDARATIDDVPPTDAEKYRTLYTDPYTCTAQNAPLYDDLAAAQAECEQALRAARTDGDQLDLSWSADSARPSLWELMVRTPRLDAPVHSGYAVVVAGSVFDEP
jgi:hypothetical protein